VPTIFGHIHKPQEIHGAHYAGSIGRNDWGEVEEKRYLELVFDDEETAIDSHPIACTPLYHVEGNLTRDGFTWRVTRGPDGEQLEPPASWAGCEVRVRYRFNADEKSALDTAQILAEFATAKRLELDPIGIRNRAIRSVEVATASTLAEKVAAFVRQSGGAWSPSLETKLALLQEPDGGASLTRVANQPTLTDLEEITV
jgi:DNA repair exonuclease SbcCD nuclease subunit